MPTVDQLMQLLAQGKPKQARPVQGFDPDFLNDESIDPSVRVDAGSSAMQGELRDRAFQAKRTAGMPGGASANEVGALSDLLGSYQNEQAHSGIAADTAAYDASNRDTQSAVSEGYSAQGDGMSAVQARNIHKRNLAEEQMRQPVAVEGMRQSGENFRQGQQIDATQRQVETQMRPSQTYADTYAAQAAKLGSGEMDPSNVKALGKNGITFQTRATKPSQVPMIRDLSTARNNLGAGGVQDPWSNWGAGSKEQQYFEQTVNNVIANSNLDPESQNHFYDWLTNPQGQAFEVAFPNPGPGASSVDHQDWNEARRLAIMLRGQ